MPQSAIQHVRVDHVLQIEEIAPMLVRLAATGADAQEGDDLVPEDVSIEVNIAKSNKATEAGVLKLGVPSIFACPECHGVLLEMKERVPLRFRCHTGHAYSVESLLSEMDEAIEEGLWSAVRALEERAMLLRHAGRHLPRPGGLSAGDFEADVLETQQRAEAVRQVLFEAAEQKALRQA